MKSRVFVVQQPAYFDRTQGKFVPKYDLSPAGAFGELVFMLNSGNIFRDRMSQAIRQMTAALENFSERDYILAVGDPVAIAIAVILASKRTSGKIMLLKWDRISSAYESFAVAC